MLSAQPSTNSRNDTTGKVWINRDDAARVFSAAQKYKVAIDHIELLKKDTASLGREIRSLNWALAALQKADTLQEARIATIKDEIAIHEEKFNVAGKRIAELEKENKKLRRRVRWTSISAIVITGAAIYLSTK